MVETVVKANVGKLEEEEKGRIFEAVEEKVDWCGPRVSWKKRLLARFNNGCKKSYLKSTHNSDSREDPRGEGTQGVHDS